MHTLSKAVLYLNLQNLYKSCHVENKLYLLGFDKYIANILVSLNFCIPSFFFVNGLEAHYVIPGSLKCIPGINLYLANLLLFHSFYTLKTKEGLLKGFYLKVSLFLNYLIIH